MGNKREIGGSFAKFPEAECSQRFEIKTETSAMEIEMGCQLQLPVLGPAGILEAEKNPKVVVLVL